MRRKTITSIYSYTMLTQPFPQVYCAWHEPIASLLLYACRARRNKHGSSCRFVRVDVALLVWHIAAVPRALTVSASRVMTQVLKADLSSRGSCAGAFHFGKARCAAHSSGMRTMMSVRVLYMCVQASHVDGLRGGGGWKKDAYVPRRTYEMAASGVFSSFFAHSKTCCVD